MYFRYISFLLLSLVELANAQNLSGDQMSGKVVESHQYFKYFSVLLRDTSSPYNRISNNYINHGSSMQTRQTRDYESVIIDSNLMISVEEYFKTIYAKDTVIAYKGGQLTIRKRDYARLFKYVRLYVGFLDDIQDTGIVIQFLKPAQFRRDPGYKIHLNLLVDPDSRKSSKLRFIILTKKKDEIDVEGCFPADFFQ